MKERSVYFIFCFLFDLCRVFFLLNTTIVDSKLLLNFQWTQSDKLGNRLYSIQTTLTYQPAMIPIDYPEHIGLYTVICYSK